MRYNKSCVWGPWYDESKRGLNNVKLIFGVWYVGILIDTHRSVPLYGGSDVRSLRRVAFESRTAWCCVRASRTAVTVMFRSVAPELNWTDANATLHSRDRIHGQLQRHTGFAVSRKGVPGESSVCFFLL